MAHPAIRLERKFRRSRHAVSLLLPKARKIADAAFIPLFSTDRRSLFSGLGMDYRDGTVLGPISEIPKVESKGSPAGKLGGSGLMLATYLPDAAAPAEAVAIVWLR